MIFWIFVILTIVGIIATVVGNKKDLGATLTIGMITLVVSGFIVVVMATVIVVAQISADGQRKSYEQRYNALIYKAQAESIRDEFGIVNKEYIDEVQAWNEDLAKYQDYSHNFWIGIFYPKHQYEGFELIDLESIKMKE